jgi:hypothetical protein
MGDSKSSEHDFFVQNLHLLSHGSLDRSFTRIDSCILFVFVRRYVRAESEEQMSQRDIINHKDVNGNYCLCI